MNTQIIGIFAVVAAAVSFGTVPAWAHMAEGPMGESMYHMHVGESVIFPMDSSDVAKFVINDALNELKAGNSTGAMSVLESAAPIFASADVNLIGVNATE